MYLLVVKIVGVPPRWGTSATSGLVGRRDLALARLLLLGLDVLLREVDDVVVVRFVVVLAAFRGETADITSIETTRMLVGYILDVRN